MPPSKPARSRVPAPLRITLLYAAFGVAWIVAGDLILWSRGGVTSTALVMELLKGGVFVSASAILLYVLVRREIERRRAAAAQLETVLQTAPVGIAAVAPDGTICRWNMAAGAMLGWSEREVLGRRPEELGLEIPAAYHGAIHDAAVPDRNGEPVQLRIFTSDDHGELDGARAIVFRDRRSQIEIEEALRQAHKLEAVGRLAGGIAHEFNNVLTAIIGHATMLGDQLDPEDQSVQHAQEIRRSGERAAALTRQLLVFSGRHVTRTAPIDLSQMLHDLRGVVARVAGETITMEYALEESSWPVRCDPAQLHQLVLNLVLNARDAMTGAGRITLETSNVTIDSARTPDPVPPGDYVLLRVSDTGAGMDADTLARLFEPFFTTKDQGTGLGLATVYGIVQQCDGHIRVRSQTGQGSVFDIYLPRAADVEPAAAAPAKPAPPGAALLVVEDDDAVRDLTCRVLRRHGHRVLCARNGIEALDILSQGEEIRLVVADIVMPGMNGIELGDRIRREYPGLPVLYTSGFVAGTTADGAGLAPDSNFMQKPYRPDELIARIDELLVSTPAE